MGRHTLNESVRITQSFAPKAQTAATTLYNGLADNLASGIDTAGYKEALVVVSTGAIAASGVATITVWSSDTDDATGSLTQLSGATMTIADTEDDGVYVGKIDLRNLAGRYMWVRMVKATTDSTLFGCDVILAEKVEEPTSQVNTLEFTA